MKKVFLLVIAAVVFITAAAGTRAQIAIDADSALLWKTLPYQYGVTGEILNAVYSPDETKIIVTTTEKWCELDAETGAFIRMLPDSIRGLAKFTENGEYFISYALQKVRYSDLQVLGQYKMPEDIAGWTFSGFDVCEKANIVLAYIHHAKQQPVPEASIIAFNYTTFQEQKRTGIDGHYMHGVIISPTGEYFLTQSYYNPDLSTENENRWVCTQWDVQTLEPIKELPQIIDNQLSILVFSNDGSWIASQLQKKLNIFDAKSFELHNSFDALLDGGMRVNFNPESNLVISGSLADIYMHSNVSIYDIQENRLVYKYLFNFEKMAVQRAEINKASNRILTSSSLNVSLIKIGITSTTEPQKEELLRPNPTNGIVSFVLNNFEGKLKISVTDTRGKEIFSQARFTDINKRIILNLSEFDSGVYFVNCYDLRKGSLIRTLKLIKE